MEIQKAVEKAEKIFTDLDIARFKESPLKIDRVKDNPEAGRYFMMFAEWNKVNITEIFNSINAETAKNTHVYVDFVFCKTLCNFCAFYGVVPKNIRDLENYVDCLIKEIKMLNSVYFKQGFQASSLEYGGGTPTFIPLDLLKKVTDTIFDEFPFVKGCEFNFEASPETLTGQEGLDKLEYLKRKGANRMSLGIQSFDEKILRATNRPHNVNDVHLSIENLKRVGFDRINVDLMLGLNEQTIGSFLDSLQRTIDYDIDIIEVYTMRYFDTKEYVLSKNKLQNQEGFWSFKDIMTARIAADILLNNAGYISKNGRTYERKGSSYNFYAAYYEGNFSGQNTLGIGRKSNSNVYPWQYANYRNLEKYHAAIEQGHLPIATGVRFTTNKRTAKLISGAFQLYELIDYDLIKEGFSSDLKLKYDNLFESFITYNLLEKVEGKYKKTFLGSLFIEEMLKEVYNLAVTPYNSSSPFLGKKQAG